MGQSQSASAPRLIEALGWFGVIAYILAYFLQSHGLLTENSLYVQLNTIAAFCVGTVSLKQRAVQSLVIQLVWIAIGLSAILSAG